MAFPGMVRVTTYFIIRNGVKTSTTNRDEYMKAVSGCTKMPVSGSRRRELWEDYKASKDKIEVHIIGNYSDMGSYIEEYYKEV